MRARNALLWLLLLPYLPISTALAVQDPIRVTFDMHVDPVNNNLSNAAKHDTYVQRTGFMEWVLDQSEVYGVSISFLSSGWYMEFLVDEGATGEGAALLQRIYDSGGQIGSHHHDEWRVGTFDWPKQGSSVPLVAARKQWQDNIEWVDLGIQTAITSGAPLVVREINRVKGAHVPSIEVEYHLLMSDFGMEAREPGPEEDYYGYFGHHIWHPFRPSTANAMAEDLTAPFVQITGGSVIGLQQIHHGTLQDMTPPSMKRQFLQIYLNWRHAHRTGAEPRVWTYGWGSHAHNFDPAEASRAALVEMLAWIEDHWRNRTEPDGSAVMQYATHNQVADAYLAWETAHPGTSSFSFESLIAGDWSTYPWIRPIAEEMRDYLWTEDLNLIGVEAFALEKAGDAAVVTWKDDGGFVNVDLSSRFAGPVDVLGLETGTLHSAAGGVAPNAIAVGIEPLWVTATRPASELPSIAPGGLLVLALLVVGGVGVRMRQSSRG